MEQARNFTALKLKSTNIEYNGRNLAYQDLIDFRTEPYKSLMNVVGNNPLIGERDKLTAMPTGLTCGLVNIADLTPNAHGYWGMGNLINARGWYDESGMGANLQLISTGNFLAFRNGNGSTFNNITPVWHYGNTVRDGSGYLRPSSPIIQIFPDGTFITNDESEGATVSRLGLGHYRITGVLGYNSDGAWGVHGGISVPRDVNGNELVYVEDKVLPDGAIEIKVTHRQNIHMPARLQNGRMKCTKEQIYYTDDEPCDLPAGTRLDVRVQMPEDSVWNLRQKTE
ncbi:hypothetical protein Xbed_03727 [Xenorhabdus beddingii]|uniref:Phage tail protein C-terminal domain-containing protein n=1 Tax=Xenorhabdus beddingii TaxID=40578 RepID=A0A1Y2S692_9GAMM|nr:hypothetical protein Xbed_03727 [Xenorhabdus beddingii]